MTPGLLYVLAQRPSPVAYMLDVCDKLRTRFDRAESGTKRKAGLLKQLLTVRFLLEVPFRQEQTTRLEWKGDDTGDIYFFDGRYRVRQLKSKFKNKRSKWCVDWDTPLSAETSALIKLYRRLQASSCRWHNMQLLFPA